MKTKSILVAMLMVIGVASANAQTVTIEKKSASVYKIMYKEEVSGKVKISITNEKGNEVFAETLKNVKSFACPLNFIGMEQGEYTVQLVDNKGTKIEKIDYQLEPRLKNVHLTKIANESKYLLAVTNAGTEIITVKIYDNSNQLVLDEIKESTNGFAQIYDMKNIAGAFTVEVSDQSGNTKIVRY